jgi:hypothetical protein
MVNARKFLRSRIGHDAAVFQENYPGSEEQRFAKVVRDKHNRLAKTASESAEFALKLCTGDGIKRAEGFIHQQNRWVCGQRSRYADALALPAGEFVRLPRGEFRTVKPYQRKKFVNARGSPRRIPFFEGRHERDVFGYRKVREKPGVLNDIPNSAT